jgi:hypothetical protein
LEHTGPDATLTLTFSDASQQITGSGIDQVCTDKHSPLFYTNKNKERKSLNNFYYMQYGAFTIQAGNYELGGVVTFNQVYPIQAH